MACHHLQKDPINFAFIGSFCKCCRAIRTASAVSFYPSRGAALCVIFVSGFKFKVSSFVSVKSLSRQLMKFILLNVLRKIYLLFSSLSKLKLKDNRNSFANFAVKKKLQNTINRILQMRLFIINGMFVNPVQLRFRIFSKLSINMFFSLKFRFQSWIFF